MKKYIYLFLVVFVATGCVAQKTDTNDNTNESGDSNDVGINSNMNVPGGDSNVDDMIVDDADDAVMIDFVSYTNKALGYVVDRPDNWYWKHLIGSQIGKDSMIDDYFITDPAPLPELGTEYLGRIVFEVSRRSVGEYETDMADLEKTMTTIDGQEVARYEGVRSNNVVENQTIIVYLFEKNEKTYRFMFMKQDAQPEEASVFEKMIKSFKFGS